MKNKPAQPEAKAPVNPYGKVFSCPELEVEIAIMNEKNEHGLNDVLLKFRGAPAFDGGVDGKVMLYSSVPAGTGTDFKYKQGKDERTRMITRDTWGGWSFFEVYFNKKTYKVYHDEIKSKDARPQHLYTEYKGKKTA